MNKKESYQCLEHIALGVSALYAVNILISGNVMNAIDDPIMQWVHAIMVVALLLTTFFNFVIWTIKLILTILPYGKRLLINMISNE